MDAAAGPWDQFRSLLKQQLALLEKMLAAARKQNGALRRNNREALSEAINELAALARQMELREAQRREAQRQLEEERHLPPAETLRELSANLPPAAAGELAALAKALQDRAGELAQLVKLNNLLTRNALQFNTRLLQAIAPAVPGAPAPGQTYLSDGKVESGNNLLSLVDKSI